MYNNNYGKMRPMSLYESGESTGEVSLKEMFNQPEQLSATNKLNIDDLAFLICRGGWSEDVDMDKDVALDQAFDALNVMLSYI